MAAFQEHDARAGKPVSDKVKLQLEVARVAEPADEKTATSENAFIGILLFHLAR